MLTVRVALSVAAASGANAAAAQDIGELSLISAAQDCRVGEVADLIRQGVNLNAINSGGYTPLMMAAGNGCTEAVRLLLQGGADTGIRHPSFGDAAAQARLHRQDAVVALIEAAARQPQSQAAPPAPRAHAPAPNGARPAAAPRGGTDGHGWPRLGAYSAGSEVLYSGTAGKTWDRGRIRNIDPAYGYNIEGVTGSTDAYFVVAPEREQFWTGWFAGDWRVSVPMATGTVTDGRNLYRTVTGGMRLPPLRIDADGSYAWRVQQGGGERLIRGRWIPNPDGPGIILQDAEHGADWLVYNNTRTGSELGDTVILSAEGHTYYDGSRL